MYTLIITVYDGTETVNTTLTISVVDSNDPPQILNGPYTVTVDENDVSATVVNVTAVDLDSGESHFVVQTYNRNEEKLNIAFLMTWLCSTLNLKFL